MHAVTEQDLRFKVQFFVFNQRTAIGIQAFYIEFAVDLFNDGMKHGHFVGLKLQIGIGMVANDCFLPQLLERDFMDDGAGLENPQFITRVKFCGIPCEQLC